jgi:2,4-dienoyl-CoA reductase-like NADH-dependent reductase (Old Yellow Enzyme family)
VYKKQNSHAFDLYFSFHGDNGDFYGKQHIDHYTEAAKGGTGLIILQATHVAGASTETAQWTQGSMLALQTIATNAKSCNSTVNDAAFVWWRQNR